MDKQIFQSIPLLKGLTEAELMAFIQIVSLRQYEQGDIIFNEQKGGNQLYIILSGRVEISRKTQEDKKQILTILYPPEFFGALSFMDGKPHSATAKAQEQTELAQLQRENFNTFLQTHPQASYKILHGIAGSVANLVRTMDQQYIDVVRLTYSL